MGDEGDDALAMRGVTHNGEEALALLELVLQLHGEFRRSLQPIRVMMPRQAGVRERYLSIFTESASIEWLIAALRRSAAQSCCEQESHDF